MSVHAIDINFDVRSDAGGLDPDFASPTLRRYHRILWSKQLPGGQPFMLSDAYEHYYLYHRSGLGEFRLASDSIVHSYSRWVRMKHIIESVAAEELKSFINLAYTVGGFLVFPGNKVEGLRTLNQERGVNRKINDRIDLTLECIRRFYANESSPLSEIIKRYSDFFSLFMDFKGYCEFFLLQDLVYENFSKVDFFLPFDGFIDNPLPKNLDEYVLYKERNIRFLNSRNERIEAFQKLIPG